MVQVINPTAGLGESLASLADTIGNILEPHKKFQLAMQKELATNPELMQHLADAEANSPGILKKMGYGPLADMIASVPESTSSMIARSIRPAVQQDLSTPEGQQDLKNKTLYGKTTDERARDAAQAGIAKIQLTDAQRGELDNKAMYEAYPELKDLDLNALADGVVNNGKPLDASITKRLKDAGALQTFNVLLSHKAQLKSNRDKASLRAQSGVQEEMFEKRSAQQEFNRYRGVGTPELWRRFLFDPTGQTAQHAFDLYNNPDAAKTNEDRMLIKMVDAQNKAQNVADLPAKIKVDTEIRNTMRKYGNDEMSAEATVARINDLLASRPGGVSIQAEYIEPTEGKFAKGPFKGFGAKPGKIVFTADGKQYNNYDDLWVDLHNGNIPPKNNTSNPDTFVEPGASIPMTPDDKRLHQFPPERRKAIAETNKKNFDSAMKDPDVMAIVKNKLSPSKINEVLKKVKNRDDRVRIMNALNAAGINYDSTGLQ